MTRANRPARVGCHRAAVGGLAALLLAMAAGAAPVCARNPAAAPALARLAAGLEAGRFVAYQPTGSQAINGHVTKASEASLRADLLVLRPRFDSLLTYSAINGAQAIPGIARELGFRALIVGIWNPFDEGEVRAALDAARQFPELVVGLSVGNEIVFAHRHSAAELAARIATIRAAAPAVPLAATEPFHLFYEGPARALLGEVDFLLPIVHPVFQPWFRGAPAINAARFVVGVVDRLAQEFCGPVLVKETGEPTAPGDAGFSPARQAAFYRELRAAFPPSSHRAFAYFDAFDAPWRVADTQASPGYHPEEAHWGLYDEYRRPKPAATEVPPLAATGAR